MASPPAAKRQRRLRVIQSDESDQEPLVVASKSIQPSKSQARSKITTSTAKSTSSLPLRSARSTKASTAASRRTSRQSSVKSSPTSSPEKKKATENGTKSLHSFFQPAPEAERWKKLDSVKQEPVLADVEEIEDFIEDDSFDEALASVANTHSTRHLSSSLPAPKLDAARKPGLPATQISSGPKFVLQTSTAQTAIRRPPVEEDTRPWADRFGPTDLDELAVHKKKQTDVQIWLSNVLGGRDRRRLLVLKGPAGSGKTTTLSLVAKASGFDVVEWRSPSTSDFSAQGYASVSAQFGDFLGRGGTFNRLDLGEEPNYSDAASATARKQIMLVEEFPTVLTRSSAALQGFRSTISQFLAASAAPFGKLGGPVSPPVVMIISETQLASSTSTGDSFTVHRLLGPDISNDPSVSIIEFNPVAPTFISKALDLVIKKEARHSKRRRIPGPAVLKHLSEMGDVRSAVGALEFLCLKGDDNGSDWGGRVAAKRKRSGGLGQALTTMERESLQMVTQREGSLGMFHAVGKIVYNKREEPLVLNMPPPPRPPAHLDYLHQDKISEVNTDTLIDETGTDIQTFIAALHENYVLSCDGDDLAETFDECIKNLSDSDLLSADSSQSNAQGRGSGSRGFGSSGLGASIDILRQDEISFHAATRGLLFALPYPVKRRPAPRSQSSSTITSRASDTFKMFYPTSLRIWRQREEIEDELELWEQRFMHEGGNVLGSISGENTFLPHRSESGVESWARRTLTSTTTPTTSSVEGDSAATTFITRLSRLDLLLDRLPYLSKITQAQNPLNQPGHSRTPGQYTTSIDQRRKRTLQASLDRVVHFGGIAAPSDDVPDAVINVKEAARGKGQRMMTDAKEANAGADIEDVPVEKLVLSDDDIEDD